MPFRVASVSFLNALPLVEALERGALSAGVEVVRDLPSRLADLLQRGEADAGLLPVVEQFRGRGGGLLGGAGIACAGPVASVKLFAWRPPAELTRVAVDRGSRTSVALLQVLLLETGGPRPQLVAWNRRAAPSPEPARPPATDALLAIGDRCLALDRHWRDDPAVTAIDLGAGGAS